MLLYTWIRMESIFFWPTKDTKKEAELPTFSKKLTSSEEMECHHGQGFRLYGSSLIIVKIKGFCIQENLIVDGTICCPEKARPLSVPFLIRTSGKGTDTATTLELEKSRRIDFSLGRWPTRGKKRPNWWGNMPVEPWDLSEFFSIHFCGRGSHFPQGNFFFFWKRY